jgi:hypothetical protein
MTQPSAHCRCLSAAEPQLQSAETHFPPCPPGTRTSARPPNVGRARASQHRALPPSVGNPKLQGPSGLLRVRVENQTWRTDGFLGGAGVEMTR